MKSIAVVLFLCVAIPYVEAAVQKGNNTEDEKTENAGGASFKLSKRGGMMTLKRKGGTLMMKAGHIIELDADMKQIGEPVSFEGADFTFEKSKNDSSLGVDAAMLKMTTTVAAHTLKFNLYLFHKDGIITGQDGNEYKVQKGTLKMNLEYDINPHNSSVKYRDFHLLAKCGKNTKKPQKDAKQMGKIGGKSKSKRNPISNKICDTARVTFSTSYKLNDADWEEMPEDYPKPLELSQDGYAGVVLRFKVGRVYYDPVTEVGDDINDVDGWEKSNDAKQLSCFTMFSFVSIFFVKLLMF